MSPSDKHDQVLHIKRTIVRLLGAGGNPLPADDTPLTALAPDSFALVEMAFRLQEELPVNLAQSDLGSTATLGELARLIATRTARHS